jgi:hypothetical protein
MARKARAPVEHVFIPDTQVQKGVDTKHLEAAGNYIAAHKPGVIVVAGDWWDMPSLSSYEKKGSAYFEGRRYQDDVNAGNEAMHRFLTPIVTGDKDYKPRMVFLMGNHEDRIRRATEADPVLKGVLGFDDLYLDFFEVHDYRKIVEIDGILYSHFFQNPQSLIRGALSGTIDNRLNKIKQSFTQGHQQTLLWGAQYTPTGRRIIGCVAGAFYSHQEEYQGPQGNNYWRGIVYKHQVLKGEYDPMMLSLDYLVREWL